MTWLGLIPAADGDIPSSPAVMAIAEHLDEARAAVSAGADIIDFGDIDLRDPARADIAAFLAEHPGLAFSVRDGGDGSASIRRLAPTRPDDAVLICADLAAAHACGHPAGRLVVLAQPSGIAAVRLAGYAAMVDADHAGSPRPRPPVLRAPASPATPAPATPAPALPTPPAPAPAWDMPGPADVAGAVAAAALSSWLGASVVRTRHPLEVRRGLAMVAVIAGIRLPVRTVRGLA